MRDHVSSLHSQDGSVLFASSGIPIEDVNNPEILAAADMLAQYYYQPLIGASSILLSTFDWGYPQWRL
jgi:hypothetical protein